MIEARRLRASDPRDKVFAMLGFSDVCRKPDYNLSIDQVYIEFVLECWVEQGETSFLLWAGFIQDAGTVLYPHLKRGVLFLPSWVPNWHHLEVNPYRGLASTKFSAGQGLPLAQPRTVASSSYIIQISGFDADIVTRTLANNVDDTDDPLAQKILQLLEDPEQPVQTDGSYASRPKPVAGGLPNTDRGKGVLLLLFGTAFHHLDPSSKEFNAHAFEMLGIILAKDDADEPTSAGDTVRPLQNLIEARPYFINEADGLGFDSTELEQIKTRFKTTISLDNPATSNLYSAALLHFILNIRFRHVIWTKSGRLGWGSRETGPGDTIWLFSGCPNPIILRKMEDEGRYMVIGPCEVPGFMDGELQREMFQGDEDRMAKAMQTIELA